MDVADAAGEEVDTESGDLLALVGVGDLALTNDTVLDATDAADLGLDGDALLVGDLHDLSGAVEVDLEGLLVGAVVHYGGEAGLDALKAVLVGAVIEVQGDRDGHAGGLDGGLHHVGADLEAAHPLGGAGGALDNQRGLGLLGGLEDGKRPLQVVGVKRAESVVTGLGVLQHLSCIDEHIGPPIVHTLNGKRLHFTTRTEARRVQTRCKPT